MDIGANFVLQANCMNISFTEKQEKYIAGQLQNCDFQNASEVVRDALRLTSYTGIRYWMNCAWRLQKVGMGLRANALLVIL